MSVSFGHVPTLNSFPSRSARTVQDSVPACPDVCPARPGKEAVELLSYAGLGRETKRETLARVDRGRSWMAGSAGPEQRPEGPRVAYRVRVAVVVEVGEHIVA